MDKTYVLLLFAAKPSDVYVALNKTSREKAREYLKDKYLAEPRWKYEMIETFLDEKKTMTYQDYLENIYYDPQHLGSLGGVDKLQGRPTRRKIRAGKSQDQKMVGNARNVRSAPSDQQKIPETQSDRPVHRLPVGRRYCRDEIVCQRQRRVRLLCSGHRRLFPLRAHVSLTLDSRQGNVVRTADFIPSR